MAAYSSGAAATTKGEWTNHRQQKHSSKKFTAKNLVSQTMQKNLFIDITSNGWHATFMSKVSQYFVSICSFKASMQSLPTNKKDLDDKKVNLQCTVGCIVVRPKQSPDSNIAITYTSVRLTTLTADGLVRIIYFLPEDLKMMEKLINRSGMTINC